MQKFNRAILLLRILLLALVVLAFIQTTVQLIPFDWQHFQTHFLPSVFILFLPLTIVRLVRLIVTESRDVVISGEGIQVRGLFRRTPHLVKRHEIRGYKIEKYQWNFLTLPGFQPFWRFEARMVVIYSNHRAILHFKSLNYWGLKKIIGSLEAASYEELHLSRRYFNRYRYQRI